MARKMTEEQIQEAKLLYLGGDVTMAELAERYGVSTYAIRWHSKQDRWPTPRRIASALKRYDLPLTDPSKAAAVDWERRKRDSREKTFKGASAAMEKFWKRPPTPKDWAEATKAQALLDKALDPEAGHEGERGVNIAILNGTINPYQQ